MPLRGAAVRRSARDPSNTHGFWVRGLLAFLGVESARNWEPCLVGGELCSVS